MTTKQRILSLLFFISGGCGLLYQVIWARMAMFSFGVITPVLSVVISVYMLGLFVGSWGGGKIIGPLTARTKISPIIFYGLCEFGIGVGAFAVPKLFSLGAASVLRMGELDSSSYLFSSAVVISFAILPWCIFMGATFPFMMAYIKESEIGDGTSFSFLYTANVIGAMFGTILTAVVLVEIYGFAHTLMLAALFNFLVAILSFGLGRSGADKPLPEISAIPPEIQSDEALIKKPEAASEGTEAIPADRMPPALTPLLLFMTGLVSMAMEVVWTRAFTPVLTTTIYAFASLLVAYLLATWIGSVFYRWHLKRSKAWPTDHIIAYLSVFAFFPIVINDPRLTNSPWVVWLSIMPFCAALGYLTPKLIDEHAAGSPQSAGRVYALNILGCIIGPLIAGYGLLPSMGVRYSLVLLAIPFLLFYLGNVVSRRPGAKYADLGVVSFALLLASLFLSISYEDGAFARDQVVRRDYTATVISYGTGMNKRLLVNGIGITVLTPLTKVMAHLPLAYRPGKPHSALGICFGMGTTFRSMMSWDIDVTHVELVPSVKNAFGFYFSDADTFLKNPKGHIVIDDGRRFLSRTAKKFDVITLDPPPPVEAAGSSLLYSEEFYGVVKDHLTDDGILQQWFPGGEGVIGQAVAHSLAKSFPYVKYYRGLDGEGIHFLASKKPLVTPTADEMISRMPPKAQADLMEWFPNQNIKAVVTAILKPELQLDPAILQNDNLRITDDKPFNEYYFLRRQPFFRQLIPGLQ